MSWFHILCLIVKHLNSSCFWAARFLILYFLNANLTTLNLAKVFKCTQWLSLQNLKCWLQGLSLIEHLKRTWIATTWGIYVEVIHSCQHRLWLEGGKYLRKSGYCIHWNSWVENLVTLFWASKTLKFLIDIHLAWIGWVHLLRILPIILSICMVH